MGQDAPPPPAAAEAPTSPQDAAPPASPPPAEQAAPTPPGQATGQEVVVTGRSRRGDPLEPINAQTFAATEAVDKALVGPAARAYKKGLPRPIRKGLRNFLANFREPVVSVNYLLQLKPGKAAETLGRFAINSTIGVAGLVDVAKKPPFNLPRRRNSFANTLGYYGVKPGPYFILPLVGSTTLRDFAGTVVDQVLVPIGPIQPLQGQAYTIPVAVLSTLDNRAEFEDELQRIRATSDPYAASRRFYLERRQAEIDALRGKRPPLPVSDAVAPALNPVEPPPTPESPQ
ncbi:MlaA family lipoprotein [Sphingomonas lenta]|uniref:ABC transporter n=1 Tax=Sphingomonas lenta TaxID=1141887 RepID=A0A2A2SHA0_9SPHN|nr:VacJ family lipoprotein [Sphingomonas lenta]PAX08593.1 hypothetical protein CKY28_04245 [Sphingomonas lenta]